MTPRTAPTPASAPAAHDHFVHFYDRDEVLCSEVAAFLGNGLRNGAAAILIARPAHVESICAALRRAGREPLEATRRGQLIVLDAAETLARFMLEGRVDPQRFDDVVGRLVRSTLGRHDELVAFGEMVSILWGDGNPAAAIELERLWNGLAAEQRFALYCAYSTAECAHAHLSDSFRQVCDEHAYLIPAEGIRGTRTEAEQVRWIAELQQRASSLENELVLRKQAEATLAAHERELADFVENAAIGLHRVGPDGSVLWANRAELKMLGYSADEYVGRNIADFYVDKDLIARILQTLRSGGTLVDQPAQLRCKDGSVRHVLVTSNALVEEGRVVSTRCFTRDVSDRWLAQEALRERGAVLHLAMQGARMGYWIGDLAANAIRCSPELSALLGEPGILEGSLDGFVERIHPEDRETIRSGLQGAITGRTMLQCEFRARKGNDWRWFEARGEAVYGDDGQAVRFYGVCADVTARRREQNLLQHLAAIVDGAEDAIIGKSLDGTITSWNAAAQRLFGYTAKEMVGGPVMKIIPASLRAEEDTIIAKVRAGERLEHFVTQRVASDGEIRKVSITVSPVRDRRGHIVGASTIARKVVAA